MKIGFSDYFSILTPNAFWLLYFLLLMTCQICALPLLSTDSPDPQADTQEVAEETQSGSSPSKSNPPEPCGLPNGCSTPVCELVSQFSRSRMLITHLGHRIISDPAMVVLSGSSLQHLHRSQSRSCNFERNEKMRNY